MTSGSRGKALWATLDARLALHNFLYEVPAYANTLPYLLGAITLMGLLVLVVTGVLLGQFYVPDPGTANASVRTIMAVVPIGSVLRGVHVWAAHLTLIVGILHLIRVVMTGSYRFPREANWTVGVLLLATVLAFFFTGTVMRWDQESLEALEHNIAVARLLGAFGGWFSPTFAAHVPLLTRLYVAHVSLLPLALFILVVAHVYLVRQHGISPPLVSGKEGPRRTFAQHLLKAAGYGLILLGISLGLAVLRPPSVGPLPVEGIEVTKPPWPFLPAYGLENWFGLPGLLWGTVAWFALLLAVPLLDRTPAPGWAGRTRALVAAGCVAVVVLGLGISAWLSHPIAHLHETVPGRKNPGAIDGHFHFGGTSVRQLVREHVPGTAPRSSDRGGGRIPNPVPGTDPVFATSHETPGPQAGPSRCPGDAGR